MSGKVRPGRVRELGRILPMREPTETERTLLSRGEDAVAERQVPMPAFFHEPIHAGALPYMSGGTPVHVSANHEGHPRRPIATTSVPEEPEERKSSLRMVVWCLCALCLAVVLVGLGVVYIILSHDNVMNVSQQITDGTSMAAKVVDSQDGQEKVEFAVAGNTIQYLLLIDRNTGEVVKVPLKLDGETRIGTTTLPESMNEQTTSILAFDGHGTTQVWRAADVLTHDDERIKKVPTSSNKVYTGGKDESVR